MYPLAVVFFFGKVSLWFCDWLTLKEQHEKERVLCSIKPDYHDLRIQV